MTEKRRITGLRVVLLEERLDGIPNGPRMMFWGAPEEGPTHGYDSLAIMCEGVERRSAWIVSDSDHNGSLALRTADTIMGDLEQNVPTPFDLPPQDIATKTFLKKRRTSGLTAPVAIKEPMADPIPNDALPAGIFVPVGDGTWLVFLHAPFYFEIDPSSWEALLPRVPGVGMRWMQYLETCAEHLCLMR